MTETTTLLAALPPHTYTVRVTRPACDIHTYVLRTPQVLPTIVDAKTMSGPWANMCKPCWDANGTGTLGTGAGQMIYAPLTAEEADLHDALPSGVCWGCDCHIVPGTNGRLTEHGSFGSDGGSFADKHAAKSHCMVHTPGRQAEAVGFEFSFEFVFG